MPIPSKEKDKKKVKYNENNDKSKIFAMIMILFVIGIATGTILYTITNSTEPVANSILKPINNTDNNNMTSENSIAPKEGYALIKLGGLNFFVKNDCAEKYRNGDYFDSYYGGKNYHTDYEHQAPWEKGPINNSQIVTMKETNGSYESFWLEISNIGDSSIADSLDYENNQSGLNITIEVIEVNGTNVTIINTGENFKSQSIGSNVTIACIEHNGKLIFLMWEGCPIDMYIIENFFKLN
ncbi:MAG: hypothetical protein LBU74_02465 [Methanobacteriaceae archaeon]|nr:hypothetical protein [Candidatus Methanorudis spinitermitis]